MEPPACAGAFTTTANRLHYVWRGMGRAQEATTIRIFNPINEQWTLQSTTGALPPGLYGGGCASIEKDLYCFDGHNGTVYFDDLRKLNLETFEWKKVHRSRKNFQTNWPVPKVGCGFTAINKRTLCCFGGYYGQTSWTSEFHLYDVKEGTS